jgi:hypothetical protein
MRWRSDGAVAIVQASSAADPDIGYCTVTRPGAVLQRQLAERLDCV